QALQVQPRPEFVAQLVLRLAGERVDEAKARQQIEAALQHDLYFRISRQCGNVGADATQHVIAIELHLVLDTGDGQLDRIGSAEQEAEVEALVQALRWNEAQ